MKYIVIAVLSICLMAGVAMSQTSLYTGGTQGVMSGMAGGPHDFTSTATDSLSQKLVGPTNFLCGYCHVPHVSSSGIAAPLWSRKSLVTGTTHTGIVFGTYTSSSMQATVNQVNTTDNYSSFCLSCHDGSQMFASAAYQSKPVPHSVAWPGTSVGFDTVRNPSYMNMSTTGSYGGLNHIHPVNFVYNSALAAADPGLYDPGAQKYLYNDATYGAVGRLFPDGSGNYTMQCPSCHNPHINVANTPASGGSYPLIEGTLDGGKLCVSCHKK
ncbi:MAG: hypothetical protein ACHQQQ_13510 [Bacteroidota bacterium]